MNRSKITNLVITFTAAVTLVPAAQAANRLDRIPIEALNGARVMIDGPVALDINETKFSRTPYAKAHDLVEFGIQKGRAVHVGDLKANQTYCKKAVIRPAISDLDIGFFAQAAMFSGINQVHVVPLTPAPNGINKAQLIFSRELRDGRVEQFSLECSSPQEKSLTIGSLKKALGLHDQQLRIAFNRQVLQSSGKPQKRKPVNVQFESSSDQTEEATVVAAQ